MARDMGPAAVAAHGTWAHGTRQAHGTRHMGAPWERKQSFIQEDKDASAEWEGAQFYELSYAILFHPKLGFNEGELVEKRALIEVSRAARRGGAGPPILMQGRASCSQLRSSAQQLTRLLTAISGDLSAFIC